MSEHEQAEIVTQDELTALKARADQLGVNYHPSIGVEKLRDKVNKALAEEADTVPEGDIEAVEGDEPGVAQVQENLRRKDESEAQWRARLKRKASELVRIRVTCMNPNKREWEGEFFKVSNAVIGTFNRYVPFNAEDGWHVERVILEQLKERQVQVFIKKRGPRGEQLKEGKLIKEFAIEELPPLTEKELKELGRRQAMRNGVE